MLVVPEYSPREGDIITMYGTWTYGKWGPFKCVYFPIMVNSQFPAVWKVLVSARSYSLLSQIEKIRQEENTLTGVKLRIYKKGKRYHIEYVGKDDEDLKKLEKFEDKIKETLQVLSGERIPRDS